MKKALKIFFVISICFATFAVSDSYGYNYSSQTFWGWRTVESTGALPVLATGLSDSDHPCNHFLMSDRKAKRGSGNKVTPNRTSTASKKLSPVNESYLNHLLHSSLQKKKDEQLYLVLKNYFDWDGASNAIESIGFLQTCFFSTEKVPASKWNPQFIADLTWSINRLYTFLSAIHQVYEIEKRTRQVNEERTRAYIASIEQQSKILKNGRG